MHLRRQLRCAPTRWPGATSWSSSGSTGRAARDWSSARVPPGRSSTSWPSRSRPTPALDRPARGGAVHLAHVGRQRHGPAPRGPAALRGQRRRGHLGVARRADPGGAPRGWPGGQLEPGGRLQGHLGGGRRAGRCPVLPPRQTARVWPDPPMDAGPLVEGDSSVATTAAATASDPGPAEPGGRVDLLGRPLCRAGRGHGAHPRRVGLSGARAERRRGLPRRPPPPGRHGPARSRDRNAVAGHRAPGHRPREPLVDRRRAGRGPGEHPGRAPRGAGRVLGAHQRHLVAPARPVAGQPPGGPAPYLSFVKTQCAGHHRAWPTP